MEDLISRQFAIDAIGHIFPVDTEYDCTLLDRVDVRRVLSDLPSAQPLTEEDYIELHDRFGTYVEEVVRDMISGEGKRWKEKI